MEGECLFHAKNTKNCQTILNFGPELLKSGLLANASREAVPTSAFRRQEMGVPLIISAVDESNAMMN